MKSNTYGTAFNQAYWPLSGRNPGRDPGRDRPHNHRSLRVRFGDLWNRFKAHLNTASEPRVWETQTAAGCPVWNAYDPISGRILRSATPSEVRIWLEERYYFPSTRQRF